jgi:hypothetical protein
VFQNAQVLRYGDPCDIKGLGQVAHNSGAGRQSREQRPTRAIGKRVKDRIEAILVRCPLGSTA